MKEDFSPVPWVVIGALLLVTFASVADNSHVQSVEIVELVDGDGVRVLAAVPEYTVFGEIDAEGNVNAEEYDTYQLFTSEGKHVVASVSDFEILGELDENGNLLDSYENLAGAAFRSDRLCKRYRDMIQAYRQKWNPLNEPTKEPYVATADRAKMCGSSEFTRARTAHRFFKARNCDPQMVDAASMTQIETAMQACQTTTASGSTINVRNLRFTSLSRQSRQASASVASAQTPDCRDAYTTVALYNKGRWRQSQGMVRSLTSSSNKPDEIKKTCGFYNDEYKKAFDTLRTCSDSRSQRLARSTAVRRTQDRSDTLCQAVTPACSAAYATITSFNSNRKRSQQGMVRNLRTRNPNPTKLTATCAHYNGVYQNAWTTLQTCKDKKSLRLLQNRRTKRFQGYATTLCQNVQSTQPVQATPVQTNPQPATPIAPPPSTQIPPAAPVATPAPTTPVVQQPNVRPPANTPLPTPSANTPLTQPVTTPSQPTQPPTSTPSTPASPTTLADYVNPLFTPTERGRVIVTGGPTASNLNSLLGGRLINALQPLDVLTTNPGATTDEFTVPADALQENIIALGTCDNVVVAELLGAQCTSLLPNPGIALIQLFKNNGKTQVAVAGVTDTEVEFAVDFLVAGVSGSHGMTGDKVCVDSNSQLSACDAAGSVSSASTSGQGTSGTTQSGQTTQSTAQNTGTSSGSQSSGATTQSTTSSTAAGQGTSQSGTTSGQSTSTSQTSQSSTQPIVVPPVSQAPPPDVPKQNDTNQTNGTEPKDPTPPSSGAASGTSSSTQSGQTSPASTTQNTPPAQTTQTPPPATPAQPPATTITNAQQCAHPQYYGAHAGMIGQPCTTRLETRVYNCANNICQDAIQCTQMADGTLRWVALI